MWESLGRMLLLMGFFLLVMGGLLLTAGKFFGLGRLPGDIFIQRGNFTFYFPLVSGLVISAVLSLLLTVVFGFLMRR
ncbi:MAG: DUF2905 domain-containing protein [Firmicutes bacterium]|nr:DUF2905 domain-containing protein [Bacillota bacterium]